MARSLRSFHGRRARSGRTAARAAAGPRSTIDHQPCRPSAMSTIIHASCQGQAGAAAVEWPAAVPCRAFWANYCSELLIINSTSPASAASIKPPLTRDKLLERILISSAPPRQPPPSRYFESHTPHATLDTRHSALALLCAHTTIIDISGCTWSCQCASPLVVSYAPLQSCVS
jgi:hypothetical protein